MPRFDYLSMQKKWDDRWQAQNLYHPDMESAKNPYYCLYMFPYPSAEGLHVGHAFSGTGADVYARFKRMRGEDVFQPMGFDAFGIHSENFALKINDHPQNLINRATKHFKEQFDSLGLSYDWRHSVNTSSPEYYKWTQWLFIQLFKAGLAEKKKAEVNWCPSCKTVLADEQVLSGECERCGSVVEKKLLEQWFFKITKYSDQLLEGLDRIDWTEKVKLAQRNWIGKSEGLLFTAPVKDTNLYIDTFSAHFEAFFADTFVVIAPDHPRLSEILEGVENKQEIEDFCARLIGERKNEKPGQEKEPEGIFTGRYIVDPIGNGDLPIWVANYALKDYGTGIVKCSAHDERDFAFANKYGIKLKPVLFPKDSAEAEKVRNLEICFTDMKDGILSEPEKFDGRVAGEVRDQIVDYAVEKGFAKPISQYHLRDWLISRQRYWGAPIPMVKCEKDGWVPVEEEDLPVLLPYVEDFKPLGIHSAGSGQAGVGPLARDEDFVNTKCPKCGGDAQRETDVADTFLDSSWYFLRYPSTYFEDIAFDPEITKKWLPVNMYIGGAEHSVLHLLYSRFITKVLHDQGLLGFDEPFTKFRAHGLIIKDGAKMSKSRGNVVNPDEYIAKYGADTLRAYLMFLGPFDQGGDFRDSGIEGMERFLKRVKVIVEEYSGVDHSTSSRLENQDSKTSANSDALNRSLAKTVKNVGDDIESLRYNTSLAKIMELVNDLYASKHSISSDHLKSLVLMLAPFAPYLTEELWEKLGGENSVHSQSWPSFDPNLVEESSFTLAIQINGKVRATVEIDSSLDEKAVKALAVENEKIKAHVEGKEIRKVIYVPGKVLNLVV